jgi:hypothetical protein
MSLARKTQLRRTGELKRGSPVKPRNPERKAKVFAEAFGDEASAVRRLPCCVRSRMTMHCPDHTCSGDIVAAHVMARGRSRKGGRFDLVPLCDRHHREAGEARTSEREKFEAKFGVNLRLLADAIAVNHERPLGLCEVANLWAQSEAISSYDTAALFGFAVRQGDLHFALHGSENGWTARFQLALAESLGLPITSAESLLAFADWKPPT